MLSRTSQAPVAVPGRDEPLHLTREELDRIAGPLVARAVDETRRVCERAGTVPAVLLLVGGSSRMPLVASRLHARLGVPPAVPEQPELPVGYGALLAAQHLAPAAPPLSPTAAFPVSPTAPFPVSPASAAPVFPASAPPVLPGSAPVPPPYPQAPAVAPPPAVPPKTSTRARRRRSSIAYSALVLVIAVLLFGATYGYRWLTGAVGWLPGGSPFSTSDALDPVGDAVALGDGETAAAVAASPEHVFYAAVGADRHTLVVARNPDGSEAWRQNLEVEPAELALTVVGDLLIVDARKAVTHRDQDIRLTLSTKDGKTLWSGGWSGRHDVAFAGGAVIAEWRDGFKSATLARIDLKTGKALWSRTRTSDVPTFNERWIAAAGNRVVELSEDNAKATVVDAANGKVLGSGSAPLTYEHWGVAGDLLVGKLSSKAPDARGGERVAAIKMAGFGRAWTVTLPASQRLKMVKACGEGLVCAVSQGTGEPTIIAYETAKAAEKWRYQQQDIVGVDEPDWQVVGDKLVLGNSPFNSLEKAEVLRNGTPVWTAGKNDRPTVRAIDGDRMLVESVGVHLGGVEFRIGVTEVATGNPLGQAGVGAEPPSATAFAGNLVAVLTGDRRVLFFTLPG
jgi:outer membrane protein assembly factor BamB